MSEVSLYKAGHRTYRTHTSSLALLVRAQSGPCRGARSNGSGVTVQTFSCHRQDTEARGRTEHTPPPSRPRAWSEPGVGFMLQGSGLKVEGGGSRVEGLGLRVEGLEIRV